MNTLEETPTKIRSIEVTGHVTDEEIQKFSKQFLTVSIEDWANKLAGPGATSDKLQYKIETINSVLASETLMFKKYSHREDVLINGEKRPLTEAEYRMLIEGVNKSWEKRCEVKPFNVEKLLPSPTTKAVGMSNSRREFQAERAAVSVC